MISPVHAKHTVEDVRAARGRPASPGRSWKAIDFGQLIDAVEAAGRRVNLPPGGEWRFHLSRGGADLTASLVVDKPSSSGWLAAVGLVASNKMRQALRFYAGQVPSDGSSSVVYTAILSKRRHTQNLNVYAVVHDCLIKWENAVANLSRQLAFRRQAGVTLSDVDRLLSAAGRADLLPWSRIGSVHSYFLAHGGRTEWDLLQAFGHISMSSTPRGQLGKLLGFYQLVSGMTQEEQPCISSKAALPR